MPDPGPRALYRLRDHITGVNWRLTRFAEEVPKIRICGLCHMIPKKTVILPCGHFLCQSCHTVSDGDSGGICPLDGKPFVEDECIWNPLSNRIVKDMKAHCWNQPHGCQFVSTMDGILRHYETECAFHTAECQRCGVPVLHNELATHHMAGCGGGTPLPTTDHGDTVTMGDIRAAVEELKAFVRDPYHDQLPALQTQMNELMEQCRQDGARLMETMGFLTQSTDDIKAVVTGITCAMQEIYSQGGSGERARVGTSGVGTSGESVPWRTEKILILRRLEVLAKHSVNALEQLRQSVQPDGTPRIPTTIKSLCDSECHSDPTCTPCHEFKLSNANEVLSGGYRRGWKEWAQQIIWDRRDRFFKVTFCTSSYSTAELYIRLECFCLLPSARLPSGTLRVTVVHEDSQNNCEMHFYPVPPESSDSLYSKFYFKTSIQSLKDRGFFADGEVHFRLCLDDSSTKRR